MDRPERQEIHVKDATVSFTRDDKAHFGRPYVVAFVTEIRMKLDVLTMRDMKVLMAMLEKCAHGNTTAIDRQALSKMTKIRPNHVSEAITHLEREGMVERLGTGQYQISEEYFWKGKAQQYREQKASRRRRPVDEHRSRAD
jgi:hypothetical protein